MPKLDWIGKRYVMNHTDEVPFRLLEHMQSTLKEIGEL